MLEKRYIIIVVGVVSILLGSLLGTNATLAQSGGEYDPWLDYNQDGIIDIYDLHPLGQAYGTSGDPISARNVAVTNFPLDEKGNLKVNVTEGRSPRPRDIEVPATSGTIQWAAQPPSGMRWTVLQACILITTDATVADRYLYLYFYRTATDAFFQSQRNVYPITANKTNKAIIFGVGETYAHNVAPENANIPLPYPNVLIDSDYLRLSLVNGQPGDSYHGWFRVLEY